MAQKVDTFVFVDLVQAKSSYERLFKKTQRRIVEPAKKTRARQQHGRCTLLGSLCDGVAELLDLLVGKALDLAEDEQRRSRVG
jgi:hypothetical protein